MPELPEVETTRRSLTPRVVGATIIGATVRERRFRRPVDKTLEARVTNRRVTALDRRGKYLLFRLDDGATLLVHLGMSGSLTMLPASTPLAVHDHVAIRFDNDLMLVFNDPRRFGLMVLGSGDDFAELRNVGRDPLDAALSVDEWKALTRGRKLPIKHLLMDQRQLGGVGNIYASEMLFQAGIRPRRRAASLTRAELARLADALRAVLARAIDLGGSSISDYRDGNGNPGYFQIHHAVYDRAGEPCVTCRTPIKRLVQSGRSSFYCPKCQR